MGEPSGGGSYRTAVAIATLGALVGWIVVVPVVFLVRVPSILAARPELKTMGFHEGVTSGHPVVYLFHHFPVEASLCLLVFVWVVGVIFSVVYSAGE